MGSEMCIRDRLYPSASYNIRVSAQSPFGIGNPSSIVTAVTLSGVPQAEDGLENGPEGVQFNSTSPDSLSVSWIVSEVRRRSFASLQCHVHVHVNVAV